MLRCCKAGRLPPANADYLQGILLDERHLPKPREIAERVHFTYEQQQRLRIYTLPAVDKTEAELVELRRAKDVERKRLARRKARMQTREAYRAAVASPKPWIAAGMKERTWYRHQAKLRAAGAAAKATPQPKEEIRL
jgi:hypothetical protein